MNVLFYFLALLFLIGGLESAHASHLEADKGNSIQTDSSSLRPIFCAHGFTPTIYATFSIEPLKTANDRNGLNKATWDAVRHRVIENLTSKGYRYDQDHGQLHVSYGSFPPIDLAHPEVGLYLKLRLGAHLTDLTKWSEGAMTEGPYETPTLVALAQEVSAQIPARNAQP